MIREAIILAGGLGTRLKESIEDIPKPMAPIAGKPFLEYLLTVLAQNNFDKVILSVGYKYEVIENYFKDNYKGIKIEYSIENEPLGTGGAIKLALEKVENEYVIIINGDTFLNIDFDDFIQQCENNHAKLGMVIKHLQNPDRYGTLTIENNKITRFNEKKTVAEGYINGGIYWMQKELIMNIDFPQKFSFERDFLEKHFHDIDIEGYITDGYFIDIGIPKDYLIAQKELPQRVLL